MLTEQHRRQYAEEGYTVPDFSISQMTVRSLRAALCRVLRSNPTAPPDSDLVNAHLRKGQRGAKIDGDPAFLELGRDPRLTALLAALHTPAAGELSSPWASGIVLWGVHVFCKQPGAHGVAAGRRVPFHVDGTYWPIEPLAAATIWVALDSADTESGCALPRPRNQPPARTLTQADCVRPKSNPEITPAGARRAAPRAGGGRRAAAGRCASAARSAARPCCARTAGRKRQRAPLPALARQRRKPLEPAASGRRAALHGRGLVVQPIREQAWLRRLWLRRAAAVLGAGRCAPP